GPHGPAADVAAHPGGGGQRLHDEQPATAVAVVVHLVIEETTGQWVIAQLRRDRGTLVGDGDPDHRAQAGHLDREPAAGAAGRVLNGVGAQLDRDGDQVVAGRGVRQQHTQPAAELAQLALLPSEQPLPAVVARDAPDDRGPDPTPIGTGPAGRGPVRRVPASTDVVNTVHHGTV